MADNIQTDYFSSADFSKWLREVVPYIKTLDPNHLVTYGIGAPNFSDGRPHLEVYDLPEIDILDVGYLASYRPGDQGLSASDVSRLITNLQAYLPMGKPIIFSAYGLGTQRKLGKNVDQKTLDGWLEAYRDQTDTAFSAGASGVIFWGWGVPETKAVPLWWNLDDHDITETGFCTYIASFQKRGLTPPYRGIEDLSKE